MENNTDWWVLSDWWGEVGVKPECEAFDLPVTLDFSQSKLLWQSARWLGPSPRNSDRTSATVNWKFRWSRQLARTHPTLLSLGVTQARPTPTRTTITAVHSVQGWSFGCIATFGQEELSPILSSSASSTDSNWVSVFFFYLSFIPFFKE